MSEFLSQDDIDALLQSGFGDDDGGDDTGGSAAAGNGFLPDAAKDLGEQAVVVLNTLTGRDVSVDPGEPFLADESMVTSYLGDEEFLAVALPVSSDINGVVTITILKSKAAILYDLMIMGDGSAPYSDEVKDGVSEIFSQVSGSYTTFLREKSGEGASSEGVNIQDNDGIGMLISEESIPLTVTITDIEPFDVIATFDETMMGSLRSIYGEPEPSFGGGNILDDSNLLSQEEIDSITAAAEDISSVSMNSLEQVPPPPFPVGGMPSFGGAGAPKGSVEMLLDIDLDVSIELGRTDISIKRVLELAPGSLVELDRLAGEPVDLMVNNKVVAKGEVVVVDESFGVRIISLVSPEERIKSLK